MNTIGHCRLILEFYQYHMAKRNPPSHFPDKLGKTNETTKLV